MTVGRKPYVDTGASHGRRLNRLVADKAWEHLGLTAQEFTRRWSAGQYRDDPRPAVQALNCLMLTGQWNSF